ncbi:CU044_5270 family protein [Streptomyces sp. NPDC001530]|uniref:CU044_5270 family protein n=1 Tax=Streptomyces sp. NPDC001530 TaxID=3364582 RepID=UPI0036B10521
MTKYDDTQNDTQYDDEFTPDFAGADRLVAAGRVAPPEPAVVAAALAVVREAAAEEVRHEPVADPRPLHSRRRILWTAGAAAAVAAGAVFLPRAGSRETDDRPPATAKTAPEFLQQVAFVAVGGSKPTARYWRVEIAAEYHIPAVKIRHGVTPRPGAPTFLPAEVIRNHYVSWLSRDGLTEQSDSGEVTHLPSKDQMSWSVANKGITWDDLRTLPTTPAALKARLVGSNPQPTVWEALFNGIDALLSRAPSGPELRGALYELLAEIPGIRLRGRAKDGAGRIGTAVELDGEDRRGRLVIDPKSALLLETGVYAIGGAEDGRLVSRNTFLSVGPARTAPEPTGTPHK